MSVINWVLIHGAEAVRWLWDVVVEFLAWLWGVLDGLLNPILSPVLAALNPVCTALGDAVYFVLGFLPITWGLVVLSVAVGIVMLFGFRHLSNQRAIGRAKDDIKANLLALKLFKDDLSVMFLCQGRIAWAILRLQRYVLVPVLWMAVPMLLLLAQMGMRYQWRPLLPGEQTLMRVILESGAATPSSVAMEPHPGIVVEGPGIPGGGEVVWRVRGGALGRHTLRLVVDGQPIEKELTVGDSFERVSALRPSARWTDQLLHPAEARLPQAGGLARIEIDYPGRRSLLHGADYWVVMFFVVSMAAALALAPVLKVRF